AAAAAGESTVRLSLTRVYDLQRHTRLRQSGHASCLQVPRHPTRRQEQRARALLEAHRQLYNAALEERREAWRRGVTIRYADQSAQLTEIRRADQDGQGRWSFTSPQQ